MKYKDYICSFQNFHKIIQMKLKRTKKTNHLHGNQNFLEINKQ